MSKDVLVFSGAYLPGVKGGGPIRSLEEMIRHLPAEVTVYMITADRDLGDEHAYEGLSSRIVGTYQHRVFYWNKRDVASWWILFKLLRARKYDLLYLNSLWSPVFTVFPILLSLGLIRTSATMIAPRGELSPGALRIKGPKKHLALATWGRFLALRSPFWHASTEMEAHDIRTHFPTAEIIIQIDSHGPPPRAATPSGVRARFVFISRISPKKNLHFLLQSLLGCQEDFTLDIYGPKEDPKYWGACAQTIAELPTNVLVNYCGLLPMEKVEATLAMYDAFLFPTCGENFGHVIAESLAAGCPVICSTQTPWTHLLLQGCGNALEIDDPAVWTREIDRLASRSLERRSDDKQRTAATYAVWHEAHAPLTTAVETALTKGLAVEGSRPKFRASKDVWQ